MALLGSDFRRKLKPLAESRWAHDPFARGAYSHALPGHAGDRAVLAAPVDGRLFFAGEATSPNFFSTAHGARDSGERAAEGGGGACREDFDLLLIAGLGSEFILRERAGGSDGVSTTQCYRACRIDRRLPNLCITIVMRLDEEYLINHWRSNEAPFEFVEWFGTKHDLTSAWDKSALTFENFVSVKFQEVSIWMEGWICG